MSDRLRPARLAPASTWRIEAGTVVVAAGIRSRKFANALGEKLKTSEGASLALSLGKKRTVTAESEEILRALEDAS